MAKKDYSQFTGYAVIKTSFDSSRKTWDEEKNWEYAYMITEGLAHGTFFPQRSGRGTIFNTKEEAKLASCDIREYDRYELANRRYGYSSYKHRIWVHEVLSRGGSNGVYLPTVGEIKKGMEYIANNLKSENFRAEWADWAVAHDGMTPAQVREELIENYLNPKED